MNTKACWETSGPSREFPRAFPEMSGQPRKFPRAFFGSVVMVYFIRHFETAFYADIVLYVGLGKFLP